MLLRGFKLPNISKLIKNLVLDKRSDGTSQCWRERFSAILKGACQLHASLLYISREQITGNSVFLKQLTHSLCLRIILCQCLQTKEDAKVLSTYQHCAMRRQPGVFQSLSSLLVCPQEGEEDMGRGRKKPGEATPSKTSGHSEMFVVGLVSWPLQLEA